MLPKAELNNGSSLCWRKQFRAQNNLIKTQLSCWRIEMTFVPKRGHFQKLIDEKMVGLGPPVEGLGGRTPRTPHWRLRRGSTCLAREPACAASGSGDSGDRSHVGLELAGHALTCGSSPAELVCPGETG